MDLRGRYRLTAWLSPAFPTGGYAYSHGLEHAVEAGLVHDCATLREWITGILEFGAGWTDALFFCAAHRARPAEVDGLADLAAAMKGTRELRAGACCRGQGFKRCRSGRLGGRPNVIRRAGTSPRWHSDTQWRGPGLTEFHWRAASRPTFRPSAGFVSAGLRLVPLGHTDGQRVLAALEGIVVGSAARARCTPFAELGAAAPMVDWASMRHETQHTRLFRS